MALPRLALRNLLRNRRRTLAALAIVAVGTVSMILAGGFIQWVFWALREGTIERQSGHIRVERPGYYRSGTANPFAYLLPEHSPVWKALAAVPGVKLVTPRLSVAGLISHGETTIPFVGDGVAPDKELFLSKALGFVDGHNLSSSTAKEVILGHGLARNLGVHVGDTVALLTRTSGDSMNAMEATVAGIFYSASQAYDNVALRLPIGQAQELLRVHGAHGWLVVLNNTEQTNHFLAQFRSRFPESESHLEFIPWYAHADFYNQTVALFSRQMNVLRSIIGLIIVLSISNMLVMNVMERVGEIGTLLAIGFRRKSILQMFVTEGVLLGLAGGFVGLVVGYGLAELISSIGIPMPPPPQMSKGFTAEIRVTEALLLSAFLISFTTTMLAGLYPAWKASRQQIVDALRHNI